MAEVLVYLELADLVQLADFWVGARLKLLFPAL